MSWTSILTALTLTLITAFLVIIDGWDFWKAVEVMVAFSGGLTLVLLAVLTWMVPQPDRASVFQVFKAEIRKELAALWKTLRFK
ncbi:MAG: hypothetical protein WBM09_11660 [Gallionella sp.]